MAFVDSSCVVIEYLFTSPDHRSLTFEKLGNKRISEYLIDYSIELAQEMNSNIPFRYVAIYPVHEKLSVFYRSLNFRAFDKSGWLFFKVTQ